MYACCYYWHCYSRYTAFNVFIEELHLSGGWPHTCSDRDFVQFGTDKMFGLAERRSPKYCGNVATSAPLSSKRYFIQQVSDRGYEMDIWLNIQTGRPGNNLTLVVTPILKNCGSSNTHQRCKGGLYCIKKDLFCDNKVNCPYRGSGTGSVSYGRERLFRPKISISCISLF